MSVLLTTLLAVSTAQAGNQPARALVKLDDLADAQAVAHLALADVDRVLSELGIIAVEAADDRTVDELLDALEADSRVQWAEPDSTGRISSVVSGDPLLRAQWNLRQIGTMPAWACGARGAGTVVAVLDTGLAVGGRDAPATVPGTDLVDMDDDPYDENGHGTHVAGTIAQATGNNYGVAGMARDALIMPVRVLGADGTGYYSNIAAGIVFAAESGADVINLSLGGDSPSSTLEEAVAYAIANDVVVVAAAGNDTKGPVSFPAATPNVIAVSATTRGGDLADYSNVGSEVSFAAPGGGGEDRHGILQETVDPESDRFALVEKAGTSMATPHVAAAYAMLFSLGATRTQAEDTLIDTAKDLGEPYKDVEYGWGEIRIGKAADWYLTHVAGESGCD